VVAGGTKNSQPRAARIPYLLTADGEEFSERLPGLNATLLTR
jgi:hypothetical protein